MRNPFTKKQQDVIEFLEKAYSLLGENNEWIIRDIAKANNIKMSGWDKENERPVFEARAFRGTAKDWNIEQARLQGVR